MARDLVKKTYLKQIYASLENASDIGRPIVHKLTKIAALLYRYDMDEGEIYLF